MASGANNTMRQIKGKINELVEFAISGRCDAAILLTFSDGDNSAYPKFNPTSDTLGRLDGLLRD